MTKPHSSESRKAIWAAISSGLAKRPAGPAAAPICANAASSLPWLFTRSSKKGRPRQIGVSTPPGAIVLTASVAGLKAEPGIAAYGASKAAVIHLARIAAKEGGPDRIRVNSIAPGGVETPIWNAVPFFQNLVTSTGSEEAAFAAMGSAAGPAGRFARPEEIAAQIAFLLSEECGFVTGACFVSDGGYSL